MDKIGDVNKIPSQTQDIPTPEELSHIECPSCRQTGSIVSEALPPKTKGNDTDTVKYRFTCTSTENTAGGSGKKCGLSVTEGDYFPYLLSPITASGVAVALEKKALGQ